ncbi:MAG: tRNA glutamyl-Q(34) synthetase GluQRS [Neomegalonema sp.]|nr:tRNA glutamyl-Q(34) synthetase GluQRS [Neomegalonema sp.]
MAAIVERFAPSPNGALHLGHAFSALTAWDAAQKKKGRFLVRIEDLDRQRCRPELEAAMLEDLRWLGLNWEEPVLRQSERFEAYTDALASLEQRGLLYPCFCSRKDIDAALSAPQEGAGAADNGPDGPAYPGVCRNLSEPERANRKASGAKFALRLDMRKAIAALGGGGVVAKLSFKEIGQGPNGEKGRINLSPEQLVERCGDIALARKDFPTSYHLAVTLDDAHQGVTIVTRGEDLFGATPIHRLLQALLGRPTPHYRHHRLIRDDLGRRLAKRDKDKALAALRAEGISPEQLREQLSL